MELNWLQEVGCDRAMGGAAIWWRFTVELRHLGSDWVAIRCIGDVTSGVRSSTVARRRDTSSTVLTGTLFICEWVHVSHDLVMEIMLGFATGWWDDSVAIRGH